MSLIKRLRFAADCTTERLGENLLTDAKAHLLKPSACRFEVTLLVNSGALQDIGELDQLTLSVKLNDPRTGLALMQKTVGSADLNALLTWEEFQSGDADACHAVFEFTAAETNLDLDAVEQDFYLVLEGLDVDGNEIAFADGEITLEESGAFAEAPAGVTADLFYTKAQSDARYLLAADLTGKVNRSGDTMTGALTLAGAPTVNLHAATKAYVDAAQAAAQTASLPIGGGTLTGLLTLSGAPTTGLHAATKTYADLKLALTGGTLSGALTLSGAPTNDLHAATKKYADDLAALKLSLTGGTLSGALTLNGAPTNDLHAATKLYVDTAVADLVASSPAALDTLNELAAALGDDANFAATMTAALADKLALAGGTMTGALTLSGAPSNSLHAATKAYADLMVPLAGGTMSGLLTLSGVPTNSGHAATKSYVDTADALKLNLTGGTLSGALAFSGTGHAGVFTNRLTSAQVTALGSVTNGAVVYDTTIEAFRFREASAWKTLSAAGSGTTWLQSSGAPDNGDGVDGNYNLRDDGTIDFKASGAWSVFVAGRLPLTGGDVSGMLNIVGSQLFINGTQVVGDQQGPIADYVGAFYGSYTPTNGGYGFASAANMNALLGQLDDHTTKINAVIGLLRTHGLIDT